MVGNTKQTEIFAPTSAHQINDIIIILKGLIENNPLAVVKELQCNNKSEAIALKELELDIEKTKLERVKCEIQLFQLKQAE